MPRLLFFAVCRTLITSQEDNSLSLIGIIEGINASIANPPEDAAVPLAWTAVAVWLKTNEDEDKKYEQRIDLISPGCKILADGSVAFTMSQRTVRNVLNSNLFPVGIPGEYTFRLYAREAGEGYDWQLRSEYSINVIHPEATTSETIN